MGTITARRLAGGVWEARVEGAGAVVVTHQGRTLPEATLEGGLLRVPLPPESLSDGVQTFVVSEAATGEVLGSFALVAGEPLAEDIRAEMELLRAELDLLKRAFRRHCLETGGPTGSASGAPEGSASGSASGGAEERAEGSQGP